MMIEFKIKALKTKILFNKVLKASNRIKFKGELKLILYFSYRLQILSCLR